jgi:hypothetical protein
MAAARKSKSHIAARKSQSAMEYLTTYGWSILVIAVVVAVLFALGAFNGPNQGATSSCLAISGYQCTMPTLYSNGTMSFLAGQVSSSLTIVGAACSLSSTPPQTIPTLTNTITVGPNQAATVFASGCTLSSNAIGTKFTGYLWVQYSNGAIIQIGKVSTYVQVQVAAAQALGPNGRIAYVPITVTNGQGSSTGANFQQSITFNPSTSAYSANEASDLGNIRFYQGSTLLYSWCETGCTSASSSATFWIKIPGGVGSNSNALVNMTFLPTSNDYNSIYAGEASQLSGTYGAFDNIGAVMNSGLTYQIYYYGVTSCDSTSYQNALYAAKLGSSVSISSCATATFSSSTSPFATSGTGSTQTVDVQGSKSYVIINLDGSSYSGGSSFPNPPVANTADSWLLKAVGWADFSSSSTFSVYSDDNIALGSSTTGGGDSSGSNWLGGSSNPNNLISGWVTQGGTVYTSGSKAAGTYRLDLDYAEDGGGAVAAFWSSASVNYYSPTYPPGGVMPTTSFGSFGH